MRYLRMTAITLATCLIPINSESAFPKISLAIDQFVSQIYPKGSRYIWVINDSTSNFSNELIIDVKTELQGKENPQPHFFYYFSQKGNL